MLPRVMLPRKVRMGVRDKSSVPGPAEGVLASAMQSFSLSARAYNKILKVSRTIADLDGAEEIRTEHVPPSPCFGGQAPR